MKKENSNKKEQINPVYSITRSCSRKIQDEYHGGRRFEGHDFFSSHGYSWYYEPDENEVFITARTLQERAERDVQDAIEKTILEMMPKPTEDEKKKDAKDQAEFIQHLEIQDEDDEKIGLSEK